MTVPIAIHLSGCAASSQPLGGIAPQSVREIATVRALPHSALVGAGIRVPSLGIPGEVPRVDGGSRVLREGLGGVPEGIDARRAPPRTVELGDDEPRSDALSCGFSNPMPGGVTAGYRADTGLDIAGTPRNVYAIASGTIEYAEAGHTLWNGPGDSPFALRIRLDSPISFGERRVTHVWYAHLSELAREVHEGDAEVVHVAAGTRLGRSGSANGCAHLHLGMLLDGEVEQRWGTFLLEDDVRKVLCGTPARTRLPGPLAGI